jgi:hypothetical protein
VLSGGSKSGHRRISRHRGEGRPTAEAPPRLQVTDGVTCGARDVEDERCLSQTISSRCDMTGGGAGRLSARPVTAYGGPFNSVAIIIAILQYVQPNSFLYGSPDGLSWLRH